MAGSGGRRHSELKHMAVSESLAKYILHLIHGLSRAIYSNPCYSVQHCNVAVGRGLDLPPHCVQTHEMFPVLCSDNSEQNP